MYRKIETWLNNVLEYKISFQIPSSIKAFCFNLYEDENDVWSMELVGSESFDPDDEDWACDEITDFGTRKEPLSWKKKTAWNEVLSEVSSALQDYLENGLHADVLKSRMGVAVGFTDGNLEILYSDLSGMAQAEIPDESSIMPASKSEIPALEPAKKAVEKRMMFLLAFVIILWLSACLYFLYLHIRDNAADRQDLEKTTLENNTGQAEEKNEEIYVPATTMPDAALDSYTLIYDGRDTGLEIFLEDCTCEFNRGASIQLYSCFVDDDALDAKGYAIHIRTPEEVMQFFPVKDYLVDKNAGRLYMVRGTETFEGIEGIDLVNGINGFEMKDTYSMEGLIGDAYGLEFSESDETFDDLQVEFIGLYQEKGKTLLRGKASALYHITGKRYTVDWEIDTESLQENTKAFLADFDIHPLYAAFLRNEISVKNPFVPEDSDYSKLSFFDDMEDEDEPLVYWKSFSLVDVNGDGNAEFLFKMINSPSKEMYILGVQDDELICFDILLTHTTHMSFRVCDNGIVVWGQNYDGAEVVYYTFNDKGKEQELIHFVREGNSDSELYYDFYYLEGNEESRINLQSNEEYESLVSSYEGEEPEWFDCESFADIPSNN